MSTDNHFKSLAFTIHQVVFLLDKLADKVLQDKLELTHSQFLILTALENNQSCSQTKIAQFLELTEPAVSRQTELLLKKKLIIKNENKNNRREYILTLSAPGKKKLHEALHLLDKIYDQIFQVMDNQNKKIFAHNLAQLLDTLCSNNLLGCKAKKG